MSDYHEPAMSAEVLKYLAPKGPGLYLDGTVGGGGHTRLILQACAECRVLGVDRDPEALEEARAALADDRARVRFLHARFDRAVRDAEVSDLGLSGALLDLGVSSHQLNSDVRGFAFRRGLALDMRMDLSEESDARAFIAGASEEQLTKAFREFGEEPKARRLARELVKRRATQKIETSDDLVAALTVTYGRHPSAKAKARVFQALRIVVNDELAALETALTAIRDALRDGAVFVVISYHSLEDRLVKNAFREWSRSCVCPPELPICTCRGRALGETLTRKPVRPSDDEVERNPRARSARLRAWRRAA